MTYLLDVNALLAWRYARSAHHTAFHRWVGPIGAENLRTCAIAELGFIRVSMQAFDYRLSQAQDALADIKREAGGFIETAPSPRLPAWVLTAAQTSDAYLLQIASENGLRLATFDGKIRSPFAERIG